MTQPNPAQVPPFDGTSGNIISRAEPKVRAAGLTALLSPIALYYIYEYVPGVASLPQQVDALLGAIVVGGLTFAAGFAAKAVDRVDIFARQEAARLEAQVQPALVHTFGERAVDDVESWVRKIHDEAAPPLEEAAHTAVTAVETAVGAGVDPVTAVTTELPALEQAGEAAVETAVADGRAEGPELATEAVSGLLEAHPAVVETVGHNQELADLLRQMLALISDPTATPIGDAVQAALPTAQTELPPVPTQA